MREDIFYLLKGDYRVWGWEFAGMKGLSLKVWALRLGSKGHGGLIQFRVHKLNSKP